MKDFFLQVFGVLFAILVLAALTSWIWSIPLALLILALKK